MSKKLRYLCYSLAAATFAYLAWRYGPIAIELCTNRDSLDAYLSSIGIWAPVVFVLLTAAQVIAAPIPAIVLGVAGGFIFGLLPGFLLSLLGLFLGSMLAFGLAKWFGQPLVVRLVGQKTYDKLEPLVNGKGLLVMAVLFLLPFMPDDALCFLAALTPMRTRVFAFLVLTCRSPGIFVSSLTGSGVIALPWYVWAVVGVVSLTLCYFVWRNGKKIESWLLRLANDHE